MGNSESSAGRPLSKKIGASFKGKKEREANTGPVLKAQIGKASETFCKIPDNYSTIDQVTSALQRAGLENSNLIIAVDFTKSNEWTGKKSFGGRCLHEFTDCSSGPYEDVIRIIGKTLANFDDDNLIPCYGFGDSTTKDKSVFSFHPDDKPCQGIDTVVKTYRELVPSVRLSGPTSFAPAVNSAMRIVAERDYSFHILLIIADGQVTRAPDMPEEFLSEQEEATIRAIVAASEFPLSIIMVGVGDGPWEVMKEFDDLLPSRKFDNFQFVNYTEISERYSSCQEKMEAAFALTALMEVPDQFKAIGKLGLLGRRAALHPNLQPIDPPKPVHQPPRMMPQMQHPQQMQMQQMQQMQQQQMQQMQQMQKQQNSYPIVLGQGPRALHMMGSSNGRFSDPAVLSGFMPQGERSESSPTPPPVTGQTVRATTSLNLEMLNSAMLNSGKEGWSESTMSAYVTRSSTGFFEPLQHGSQGGHQGLQPSGFTPVANAGQSLSQRQQYSSPGSVAGGSSFKPPTPDQVPSPDPLYFCPITQEVMRDPVVAADGFTYEHHAIEAWLMNNDTSPMTNQKIPKFLTPNHSLRSCILDWRQHVGLP